MPITKPWTKAAAPLLGYRVGRYADTGSPAGVLALPVGSEYTQIDGAPGNIYWIKESGGSSSSGWRAVHPPASTGSALFDSFPALLLRAASAQAGPVDIGSSTYRLGTSSDVDAADPTYSAGPPASWGFNGAHQVSIAGPTPTPAMGPNQPFSILVVHRRASNPPGLRVIASSRTLTTTSRGTRVQINADGSIVMQLSDGATQIGVGLGTPAATGVWICSWLYSAGATHDQVVHRQNGSATTPIARTGNIESGQVLATDSSIWRLGQYLHTSTSQFVGDIRCFAAWARALTSTEMGAIESELGAGS